MTNPHTLFGTLHTLAERLDVKADKSRTKAGRLAYRDSAQLLRDEIQRIQTELIELEELKLKKQMDNFDVDHNNYESLFERGAIGIPDESHAEISDFTLGKKTASEVFENLSEQYKYNVLSSMSKDKDMIEQLAAYRHNFHYITKRTGHDGINIENTVFEVKNRKYKEKKERFSPMIIFDRVSPANLRKLDEGRPDIIFNITDEHEVLVEMKVEFTDKLVEIYKKSVENLKYSKTSGMQISFSDFKHAIYEISFKNPKIFNYHIQKQFLEYLREKSS